MSEADLHPAETILRLCAAAAPEPWYPRLFVKQEGVEPQVLGHYLEELWLSGLIERADGGPEKGPAISLTREGQRVLLDPEALQRLRTGQPISRTDRGSHLRRALYGRGRAGVTSLLILLNVMVFAWGYFEAREKRIDNDFLRGAALEGEKQVALNRIFEKSGCLSAINLVDGQWWRLLTAGFVHYGFLLLLMNMVFLYVVGRFVEPMWGHLRFLLIYLSGVLGGSCLSVAHNAGDITSASAAVCGLLGAEAVWYLFNRRYLPRELRRPLRMSAIISLVLLLFICSFRDVGRWGLIGGAAAETMTALLLQLHRFGPSLWRWFTIAGFVPMVWYGHHSIEQARLNNPGWQKAEEKHFLDRLRPQVQKATKEAYAIFEEKIEPLLEKHPTRRDPAQVKAALPFLEEQQQNLNAVIEKFDHTGPYYLAEAEEARQVGRDYVEAISEWFGEAERLLRLGEKRTDKDRQALREKQENVNKIRKKWNELFE